MKNKDISKVDHTMVCILDGLGDSSQILDRNFQEYGIEGAEERDFIGGVTRLRNAMSDKFEAYSGVFSTFFDRD